MSSAGGGGDSGAINGMEQWLTLMCVHPELCDGELDCPDVLEKFVQPQCYNQQLMNQYVDIIQRVVDSGKFNFQGLRIPVLIDGIFHCCRDYSVLIMINTSLSFSDTGGHWGGICLSGWKWEESTIRGRPVFHHTLIIT